MKFLFLFLFSGIAVFSLGQEFEITEAFLSANKLQGDSGYFQKKEADKILSFLANRIDSLNLNDAEKLFSWEESDTIGKFIYLPGKGRYFLCLNLHEYRPFGESHCVLELEKVFDKIILKNLKFFYQGNYACCWTGFDGFFRWNDYLIYKLCGTGSSLCSSTWCLFNQLSAGENQNEFIHDFWIGEEGEYSLLQCKADLLGDLLSLNYTLEKGTIKYGRKRPRLKKKTSEIILVKGMLKNGKFEFDKPLPDIDS